jgi:3-oxoacyl-[acyl-carrier protein] reductase
MQLQARTVLVTGAARGLGAAMAREFAARGASLALVDLSEDALGDTLAACRDLGATTRAYAADVSREDDVVAVYAAASDDFGRLDVSVANAGILRDGLLVKAKNGIVSDKLALADWQAVIDVNLTGVFLCGREAAARMIELGRGGCIINISSISRAGNFGQSNYSAAKAAVSALTVVWAKELARHSIRVNAIAPGFMRTDILASMKPEVLEKLTAQVPVGRIGDPGEIAHAAAFVAENDYMNGRTVEVDGGLRL